MNLPVWPARCRSLAQIAGYAFALSLPFSTYWVLDTAWNPGVLDLYVSPVLYFSDVALAAFLLTGITAVRHGAARWSGGIFMGPLLLLGMLAAVTAPFALLPVLAGYAALRWLLAVALYLRFVQRDISPVSFVSVFLIGLVLNVLVGIGQVFTQGPLGIPGEMALPLGREGAAIIDAGGEPWFRAYGLTFHPNVLGGFLTVGLLLSMSKLHRPWIRWAWWILWIGLLLTLSRAALLAALITVPLAGAWLLRTQPSLRRPLVTAFGGLLLIAFLGGLVFYPQVGARLSLAGAVERLSLSQRQEQLEMAIGILAARPISGIGAANFALAMQGSQPASAPLPVHNVPLLLASEIGVVGGGIWMWMGLAAINTVVRRRNRLSPGAMATLCAWVALWIISFFDYYPWGLTAGRLLTVTVLGLASRAEPEACCALPFTFGERRTGRDEG